jgi:tRNA A-37 threonylcarbamoyl transferase component Bud32
MNSFTEEIVTQDQLEQPICSENQLWIHPLREFDVLVIQTVISSNVSELTKLFNRFPNIRPNWITCDVSRRTALHHAVCSGNSEITHTLLSQGANPFLRDIYGQTAVHIGSRLGHVECVKIILDHVTLSWSNGIQARQHLLNIKDTKGRICNDFVNGAPNTQAFSSVVSTASSSSSLSISVEDFEMDLADLSKDERIAKGTEADVHRGRWRGTNVALKVDSEANTDTRFRNEVEILMRLRHPNLVLMMGVNLKRRIIVLEYCSGGNLFNLLHRKGLIDLSWRQRLKILMDVARGMNYLHTLPEKVIHRDLKSLNVLLHEEIVDEYDTPTAKVSDFGLSTIRRDYQTDNDGLSTVGTYQWMAPEILSRTTQDERVDIYSYGILLYEIITRTVPYGETLLTTSLFIQQVIDGFRPNVDLVDRSCPHSLVDLMRRCWSQNREERPYFAEILQSLDSTILRRSTLSSS